MTLVENHPTLPRLEPGSIERTRLLARLADARHKTCVLILGPAGCGKTTLALQWRAQALGYGHDFAWMTVMPGDDAQAMLDALFSALDRVDPQIAREARFIYNRDGELRSPDPIAIAVLRGLMQRPRPLVLLIDDYQNIADARAHALLQTWLDFAPVNFHLVLVSRSVPPLSFSRLRDRDAVTKLFTEIGPRYAKRPGGYLRILRCGYRAGDDAPMAYVELVDRPVAAAEAAE